MDLQSDSPDTKSGSKAPVVRGARACTVCRAAKMKCVGAEDGQKPCQRCKRANVECVFEKHRRGRKPGSKLSEASKMLRRLEKGLNTAKMKSQTTDSSYQSSDIRNGPSQDVLYTALRPVDSTYASSTTHFPSNELPPLNLPNYHHGNNYAPSSNGSRSMDMEDEDEDVDRNDEEFFPEKLIRRENQRNSFFRTILNPEETPAITGSSNRGNSFTPPQARLAPIPSGLNDPITAGIIDEEDAKVLFDLIFLRLNPFINLFDPTLHSVPYVRSKCPFLFTTLIMAGCKFFKPDAFKQCQKLANEFAIRAFAEAWKRVEVVQAFACLTYWKDPDDSRTWTYIGYACRMAVELGLNRYMPNPPSNETEFQRLERRNRERTYLVLFVHDRSLSTQTGRHWMLPEDDLVRHSTTWHEEGGGTMRPEDIIVAAFVALRRIAAETTDVFNASKGAGPGVHHDVNYEVVLSNCNAKLTQWADTWQHEMDRAGGEKFHSSFLSFFRLHVRLFLNSFGIQAAMSPSSRQSPSLQALTTCCTSALDSLRIVSKDFASMSMLRYGQDSITVMSAYSAVFLLKLLRSSSTFSQLNENTANDIHTLISETADAYQDASQLSPTSTSAAYHARFLRSLVSNDVFKARRNDHRERHESNMPIDPRLQGPPTSHAPTQLPTQVYSHQTQQQHDQSFHFPASPHLPAHPQPIAPEYPTELHIRNIGPGTAANYNNIVPQVPHHASELDAHYWKNMFIELGFGEHGEPIAPTTAVDHRGMSQYVDTTHHSNSQQTHQHHGHLSYSHVHQPSQPNYG
ncbi:fungal-specific transcription factor domain-containing protein [Collybia nuda]|uniref:Fungal-specific transcription factor domain-containing protein n=1 Tax=Collybia nuda TaxID=64659 RepID=A0A9P5XXQ7_9AGAR|nr:fungal-specific transcription factor domain-containing protein [Collybia nuda]